MVYFYRTRNPTQARKLICELLTTFPVPCNPTWVHEFRGGARNMFHGHVNMFYAASFWGRTLLAVCIKGLCNAFAGARSKFGVPTPTFGVP